MPYNNNYNNMINQLYRYKDNIDNMISQYNQGMMNPAAPAQTTPDPNGIDLRYLSKDDDINNIIITKKTLFIDENKAKITIKDVDGTIVKSYDIIIPKDEKDLKIEELENKIKELEGKINVQRTEPIGANDEIKSTAASATKPTKPATITSF